MSDKQDDIKQDANNVVSDIKLQDEDNETQVITLRVPKKLVKALDEIVPKGKRNEEFVSMAEQRLEKGGNSEAIKDDRFERLCVEADGYRREIDKLRKVLGHKMHLIDAIALSLMPLTPENIPRIIKYISSYSKTSLKPSDGFSAFNVLDYIRFLEEMLKHSLVQTEIDKFRAEQSKDVDVENISPRTSQDGEAKKTTRKKEQRYIPEINRCGCGVYETKEEHNPRCFHIHDEMRHGIDSTNQNTGTPQGQLMMIRKFGMDHTTSAEEKAMVVDYLKDKGTDNQKIMVNNYFLSHNFTAPFIELVNEKFEEEEEAEAETVEADSEKDSIDIDALNDA